MAYEVKGVKETRDWSLATPEELEQGYAQMAADKEREAEALEWCDALIGDGLEAR